MVQVQHWKKQALDLAAQNAELKSQVVAAETGVADARQVSHSIPGIFAELMPNFDSVPPQTCTAAKAGSLTFKDTCHQFSTLSHKAWQMPSL
jgi:hypothetical protein